MEGIRRKRSQSWLTVFASLNVFLSLLVAFAPTIHALTPHEEHASSCTHSSQTLHVEAAPREENPPCIVCAQVLGRHAVPTPARVEIVTDAHPIPFLPVVPFISRTFVPTLPDPRGPPSTT